MATVTMTMIDSPSRSKMAGPCWIAAQPGGDPVYATAAGRSLEAEAGTVVHFAGKAELRKASGRWDPIRRSWDLLVTGNAEDMVTVHVGIGQQWVSVEIVGVVKPAATEEV